MLVKLSSSDTLLLYQLQVEIDKNRGSGPQAAKALQEPFEYEFYKRMIGNKQNALYNILPLQRLKTKIDDHMVLTVSSLIKSFLSRYLEF